MERKCPARAKVVSKRLQTTRSLDRSLFSHGIFMVIFHCISTLIFNAAQVAQGANSRELELNNPSQVRGAAKLRPLTAALIHALPKIRTGKKSGKINKANIVPPRLKPTVNAAPILPSKLRAGVPTSITNMIGKKVSLSRPSNKPNSGTNNVIKSPELNQ